jgi:hypothetical protein
MKLREVLLRCLPPIDNKKVVIKQKQGTTDIINTIADVHVEYEKDYDCLIEYFDKGDIYDTAQAIWNFLKYDLVYNAEPGKDQTVKSPARILQAGATVDCKHYALFAGGILDAIERAYPGEFQWFYRFAGEKGQTDVGHVFVVAVDNKQKEIWIDPCLTAFNQRKNYSIIEDYTPMSLSKVSGVNTPATATVVVDKQIAWESFLGLLNMNFLRFKELMLKDMAVTGTAVKQYCADNGLDYNQLLNFLNA